MDHFICMVKVIPLIPISLFFGNMGSIMSALENIDQNTCHACGQKDQRPATQCIWLYCHIPGRDGIWLKTWLCDACYEGITAAEQSSTSWKLSLTDPEHR